MKQLNACGLSCPEPVLMVRNAVASGAETIEVRVDDPTPGEYYQICRKKALKYRKLRKTEYSF